MQPKQLIQSLIPLVEQAGNTIRNIYLNGQFEREIKADNTPVTSADLASHQFLMSALKQLTPEIPILSEEAADIPLADRQAWQQYWLVDPLDGTGEFIAGSGDFSVIIALVQHNRPVLGMVYAPMSQVCYYAVKGEGAYKIEHGKTQRIYSKTQGLTEDYPLRLAVSRRQDPQTILSLFQHHQHYELVTMGGAALKACLVAEGKADCYVRVGPTGEWDTGAAQIIVEEAGGEIMDVHLQPLTYNLRESLENPNFIVVGNPKLSWDKLLINI